MKLSAQQIKSIVTGAARFCEEDGKITPLRFSEEQQAIYNRPGTKGFYTRTMASSGIKAEFITDSRKMTIVSEHSEGSSRAWFSFDVRVNGELIHTFMDSIKNEEGELLNKTYTQTVELCEGEKKVTVYFPWSVKTTIVSFELDDGATLIPVRRKIKMLTYGDSITHGYDTKNPSLSYASIISDEFDAEAMNKAIGGEIFRPELAATPDGFAPDVITVAYGTNDFSKSTKEEFDANSSGFYGALARLYPSAKIIALAPIYRTDYEKPTGLGQPFNYVVSKLRDIAKDIPQMHVIDCFDFLPKTSDVFSDLRIHPNNEGFDHYAKGLVAAIKEHGIL